MKKVIFMAAALGLLITTGCNNKKKAPMEVIEVNDLSNTDKTTYGVVVGGGTSMNELQMVTDSGDTLNVSLIPAKDAGKNFGGLGSGDRVAVMVVDGEDGMKAAEEVININSLLGIWTMPNPLDGSDYVGVVLKEGGVAESINQSTLFYKSWKIFNGRLVLTGDREGGGDFEEIDTFDIKTLGADSLILQNGEDLFEYGRSKTMPKLPDDRDGLI